MVVPKSKIPRLSTEIRLAFPFAWRYARVASTRRALAAPGRVGVVGVSGGRAAKSRKAELPSKA